MADILLPCTIAYSFIAGISILFIWVVAVSPLAWVNLDSKLLHIAVGSHVGIDRLTNDVSTLETILLSPFTVKFIFSLPGFLLTQSAQLEAVDNDLHVFAVAVQWTQLHRHGSLSISRTHPWLVFDSRHPPNATCPGRI